MIKESNMIGTEGLNVGMSSYKYDFNHCGL